MSEPLHEELDLFYAWWETGVHGWGTERHCAEYKLAMDAFLAGLEAAKEKTLTSTRESSQ